MSQTVVLLKVIFFPAAFHVCSFFGFYMFTPSFGFAMIWFLFMFSYSLDYYVFHAENCIRKIVRKDNPRPRRIFWDHVNQTLEPGVV